MRLKRLYYTDKSLKKQMKLSLLNTFTINNDQFNISAIFWTCAICADLDMPSFHHSSMHMA